MLVNGQTQAKAEQAAALANTFKNITHQWHTDSLHRWRLHHAQRVLNHFEKDVFPMIGAKPLDKMAVSDVKAVIEKIASRGAAATAEKIGQWIGTVYKYAKMLEITYHTPTAVLQGFLPKVEV